MTNYPRIASYAGIASSGYPLTDSTRTVDRNMVRALARFPVVALDINSLLLRPDLSAAYIATDAAGALAGETPAGEGE